MQLDIFADSRDVMLRNDVAAALERRDATAARLARRALQAEFAEDATLGPQEVLIAALERETGCPVPDHASARDERLVLAERVGPAAERLFGPAAGRAWLVPLWRGLAERASALPFLADAADDHAAPLYLNAGEWVAAAAATARIESWRRIPAPLGWMTQARYRLDGLDASWPLLAELAWLAPKRLDAVLRELRDPTLERLRKRFEARFEGAGDADDLAWFPAWLLTDTPALARMLGLAQASRGHDSEQAMRLLLDLLELERRGRHHDLIARRRELRDVSSALYDAYMATR